MLCDPIKVTLEEVTEITPEQVETAPIEIKQKEAEDGVYIEATQTQAPGYVDGGVNEAQVKATDLEPDLKPENIKKGVNLFGVEGNAASTVVRETVPEITKNTEEGKPIIVKPVEGSGVDGFSEVEINVNVQPKLKEVKYPEDGLEYTTPGVKNITTPPGYDGLKSVSFNIKQQEPRLQRKKVKVDNSGIHEVPIEPPVNRAARTKSEAIVTADYPYQGLESVEIDADVPKVQNLKTVTKADIPGKNNVITPDGDNDAMKAVLLTMDEETTVTKSGPVPLSEGSVGIKGVNVDIPVEPKAEKITENGTYYARATDDLAGYSSVDVDVHVPEIERGKDLTEADVKAGYNEIKPTAPAEGLESVSFNLDPVKTVKENGYVAPQDGSIGLQGVDVQIPIQKKKSVTAIEGKQKVVPDGDNVAIGEVEVTVNTDKSYQTSETPITENHKTYKPQPGTVGFNQVRVDIDEPTLQESKTVTAQAGQKAVEVTPDQPNDGLKKAIVNVPTDSKYDGAAENKKITKNGTYTPEGVGYNKVVVDVPTNQDNLKQGKVIKADGSGKTVTYDPKKETPPKDGYGAFKVEMLNVQEKPAQPYKAKAGRNVVPHDAGFDAMETAEVDVNLEQKGTVDKPIVFRANTVETKTIKPDADQGYIGLSEVNIEVDVQSNVGVKSTICTENNKTYYAADGGEGYDGYSEFRVEVPIPAPKLEKKPVQEVKKNGQTIKVAYDRAQYQGLDDVEVKANIPTETKTVKENGTVTPDNPDALLSSVVVDVPNKVQAVKKSITQNGKTTVTPEDGFIGISSIEIDTKVDPKLQAKTAKNNGIVQPDPEFDGLSSVDVQVPIVEKEIKITSNSTQTFIAKNDAGNPAGYSLVRVTTDVPSKAPTLKDITLTKNGETKTATEEGVDGFSSVTANLPIKATQAFPKVDITASDMYTSPVKNVKLDLTAVDPTQEGMKEATVDIDTHIVENKQFTAEHGGQNIFDVSTDNPQDVAMMQAIVEIPLETSQTKAITNEDIGKTITITPSVNPDGGNYLGMEEVQVPVNIELPKLQETKAKTLTAAEVASGAPIAITPDDTFAGMKKVDVTVPLAPAPAITKSGNYEIALPENTVGFKGPISVNVQGTGKDTLAMAYDRLPYYVITHYGTYRDMKFDELHWPGIKDFGLDTSLMNGTYVYDTLFVEDIEKWRYSWDPGQAFPLQPGQQPSYILPKVSGVRTHDFCRDLYLGGPGPIWCGMSRIRGTVYAPNATSIKEKGFYHSYGMQWYGEKTKYTTTQMKNGCPDNYFPNVTTIGASAFAGTKNRPHFIFKKDITFQPDTFSGSSAVLDVVYMTVPNGLTSMFNYVIIRDPVRMSKCETDWSTLTYEGNIFVPENMVATYKADPNWSKIADRIHPLEFLADTSINLPEYIADPGEAPDPYKAHFVTLE